MSKEQKIAKTGFALLIITIISKVAAFLVTIGFSYFFGTDAVTDAYYAGASIPTLVNSSLSVCVLTLFIPVYTRCLSERGEEAGNEFASNVLNIFVLFSIGLVLVLSIFSPILAKVAAPGFDETGLYHTRNMICLLSLSFPITFGANLYTNLYNAHQRYIFPAFMTLLHHFLIIVGIFTVASKFGIYSYPFICVAVWIIQLLMLVLCEGRGMFRYRITIKPKNEYFRYMILQSVPVMIATAADQINLTADNMISSNLPEGSLSCIGYAHRIFGSINGLVTATLLTLYYPIISKQYAEKNREGVDRSIGKYVDIMLLLVLPMITLLILNSDYIMDILFNRGAMDTPSISKISVLFMIYVSGLLFISVKEFATRLYYIIGNTSTPTRINVVCVLLNIVLSITLKQFIGIHGIALATTISTGVCAVAECLSLIGAVGGFAVFKNHRILNYRNVIEIVSACVVAFIVSKIVCGLLSGYGNLISMIFGIVSYGLIFVGILFFSKNEYVMVFLRPIFKGNHK